MLRFYLGPFALRRLNEARERLASARVGLSRHTQPRAAAQAGPPCAPGPPSDYLPDDFETEVGARREDQLRASRIARVLNRLGPTGWTNLRDRVWLLNQRPRHLPSPPIDRNHAERLAAKLKAPADPQDPSPSLASSVGMRSIRRDVISALMEAFAPYPDAVLATVTVLYGPWAFTPAQLDRVSAKQIKNQFWSHLNRAGVTKVPGPLIGFLHGEFEPTSGFFVLHFHLLTTAAKAQVLDNLKQIKGYKTTSTGSSPIRRSKVHDRPRQFSYLLKSFWPSKAVRLIDGKEKRDRDYHRISEPFGTQVLVWLDRQKLGDLMIMNGCWSKAKGGTQAMKRLYCIVHGRGCR